MEVWTQEQSEAIRCLGVFSWRDVQISGQENPPNNTIWVFLWEPAPRHRHTIYWILTLRYSSARALSLSLSLEVPLSAHALLLVAFPSSGDSLCYGKVKWIHLLDATSCLYGRWGEGRCKWRLHATMKLKPPAHVLRSLFRLFWPLWHSLSKTINF